MSADGGRLGYRSGSVNIILKCHHPRTFNAMFALNWSTDCRRDPVRSYVKTMSVYDGQIGRSLGLLDMKAGHISNIPPVWSQLAN